MAKDHTHKAIIFSEVFLCCVFQYLQHFTSSLVVFYHMSEIEVVKETYQILYIVIGAMTFDIIPPGKEIVVYHQYITRCCLIINVIAR